jgi:SAM-dependent methyltransferase
MGRFGEMVWTDRTLDWRGQRFLLESRDIPDSSQDGLVLWKTRRLIEQYDAFFTAHSAFTPARIFELGLWKGGSLAFWHHALAPKRLVGVDLAPRCPSPIFDAYVSTHANTVSVHWGVDQADAPRLTHLVATEFDGPLDLVLDDAGHHYGSTRASLETLFPFLRPGGFYVIEDWAWAHWPEVWASFSGEIPLTRLINECIAVVGTSNEVMHRMEVRKGFVAIERGPAQICGRFDLSGAIQQQPVPQSLRALARAFVAEGWRRWGWR